MAENLPDGVQIVGPITPAVQEVLTAEALAFVADLHRRFNPTRQRLLARRAERQAALDAGEMPGFLPETAEIRTGEWQVAPAPADLNDRRVEITGPTDRKMMINALNSGASVFMADFEDALSPTWDNVIQGQINCSDAVRRTIEFLNPDGRVYKLKDQIATLLIRPRGWHLGEKHVLVDGEPISGSLFDFGLYMFRNARELVERGSGPYFYLPKLESHLEARLWNDVFNYTQDALGIPRGTIRATVLIETILAALEMEEILYELREHAAGLNAGRWDYIFSVIKKFARRPDMILPDRSQVTMTVPFMRAYTELLVRTCHKRGAHAIGGMAAFIPNRRDPEVTEKALAKVREDKERESSDGFDGTWVAHPDLVPVAREVFDRVLGDRPHQKHRLREDVHVTAEEILDIRVPGGQITEDGVRLNVSVALQYLNSWLNGNGAAAIFNLMEDAATAEISRSQLWQWLHHGAKLADGRPLTLEMYTQIREEELAKLGGSGVGRYEEATELLDGLVLSQEFVEFLTYPAYELLD
ncbi:malate synthase A [Litorilinea aerophila]|uniref:Malate synthase n=1 Tax=Litorilinea aerophila TaxID=1204385 RepID=A0A540VM32_9CHLR|nr:malate synthase A [Litorilinea aerophila]MCC9074517.1 malate synthase A [Litorilinea aerophila]GIV75661.1 MAG: malate synthase [Litorilinea sp.]